MLASLVLPLLLVVGPQEPRPTAEEPAARGAQRVDRSAEKPAEKAPEKAPEKADGKAAEKEEAPVVTKHELRLAGGRVLRYSVTTGLMPLKSDTGEVEARVFFMAYTLDRTGGPETRPLMFSFNGGPGSSSVWLHLGALGPKRVKMRTDGAMPSPPYRLVDNEYTWLDDTDLVFIDPVGTGYSRPAKPELGKKYWGVQGDIESVGEFIRLYLTRHERWASPLFLVGESYGTTRAAGLSGYLVEKGIAFNGILLVSSILNFQTARFSTGNDLPYPLFLPTYAATAWYHKRLPPDLQAKPLAEFLREVEAFAAADYPNALQKGDRMSALERQEVVKRLARYTGLSETYVDESDLRVEIQHFCKELLRREGRSVGRLDTRFRGTDSSGVAERPEFDPSMAAIRPPYTATFNDYVRRTLGYKTDTVYHILGGGIGTPWDFSSPNGFADTSQALGDAFAKNPDMRLFVASGFYDLATPYFATQYTLSHMGLSAEQRARISTGQYEAGHMMYIHEGELARLKQDVAKFIASALAKP
jgi:carboxypeptidase C (cathepsin A)